MKLKIGAWYEINDRGNGWQYAQYVGRQDGFHCIVCDHNMTRNHGRANAHTFNIPYASNGTFEQARADMDELKYETWGFGTCHLPQIKEIKGV